MKATSEINLTRLVLRAGNDSKDQSIYCEVKGEVNLLCAQCKNRIGQNLILMVVKNHNWLFLCKLFLTFALETYKVENKEHLSGSFSVENINWTFFFEFSNLGLIPINAPSFIIPLISVEYNLICKTLVISLKFTYSERLTKFSKISIVNLTVTS